MPTYAYRCSACGQEFDAVQSFHDDPLTLCPHCGQAAAKRVFRSVGVIFKGSGWYVNDTRSDRGKGSKVAESAGNGGTALAPAAAKDAETSSGSSGGSEAGTAGGDTTNAPAKATEGPAAKGSGTADGGKAGKPAKP